MKLPRPWLHTPLFPLCKTSCGLLSAPFFCMHLGGFSDAYVCSSWVLRVHTCFRLRFGMQLLGAPSAYLLPASLWYAALGCSECILASGFALLCSSCLRRVHTRYQMRS